MKKYLIITGICLMASASFADVLNCNDSFTGENAGRVEIAGDRVHYSNSRQSQEAWELRQVGAILHNADISVQSGKDIPVGTIQPALGGVEMQINGRTLVCK